MAGFEQIECAREGRVLTITLNRPERLNAWTMVMETEFITAVNQAAADDGVGCLVVTGAGRAFCAGADIHGFAERQATVEERPHAPALATTLAREASPNVALALADG